jgi:hypothetical protein
MELYFGKIYWILSGENIKKLSRKRIFQLNQRNRSIYTKFRRIYFEK